MLESPCCSVFFFPFFFSVLTDDLFLLFVFILVDFFGISLCFLHAATPYVSGVAYFYRKVSLAVSLYGQTAVPLSVGLL